MSIPANSNTVIIHQRQRRGYRITALNRGITRIETYRTLVAALHRQEVLQSMGYQYVTEVL